MTENAHVRQAIRLPWSQRKDERTRHAAIPAQRKLATCGVGRVAIPSGVCCRSRAKVAHVP